MHLGRLNNVRPHMNQRDKMRQLCSRFPDDTERIISEYARAEERGEVARLRNAHGLPALKYARALHRDGIRKSWLRT